jgi:hypothetical protein
MDEFSSKQTPSDAKVLWGDKFFEATHRHYAELVTAVAAFPAFSGKKPVQISETALSIRVNRVCGRHGGIFGRNP